MCRQADEHELVTAEGVLNVGIFHVDGSTRLQRLVELMLKARHGADGAALIGVDELPLAEKLQR